MYDRPKVSVLENQSTTKRKKIVCDYVLLIHLLLLIYSLVASPLNNLLEQKRAVLADLHNNGIVIVDSVQLCGCHGVDIHCT